MSAGTSGVQPEAFAHLPDGIDGGAAGAGDAGVALVGGAPDLELDPAQSVRSAAVVGRAVLGDGGGALLPRQLAPAGEAVGDPAHPGPVRGKARDLGALHEARGYPAAGADPLRSSQLTRLLCRPSW